MNPQPKEKPYRSKKYISWVKTLKCSCCVQRPVDCHHIIAAGLGGTMGGKAPDNYTMPLCRTHHQELHQDPKAWEAKHGRQLKFAYETVDQAGIAGIIEICNGT